MAKNRRQLSQVQAAKMAPSVKKFNSIAKVLIRLLSQKIEQKEKALGNISVVVNGSVKMERRNTLSITTVDINKTTISRKGSAAYSTGMSWEDQLKRQKRGIIL